MARIAKSSRTKLPRVALGSGNDIEATCPEEVKCGSVGHPLYERFHDRRWSFLQIGIFFGVSVGHEEVTVVSGIDSLDDCQLMVY